MSKGKWGKYGRTWEQEGLGDIPYTYQSKYFLALEKAAPPNFLLFVNTLTPMFSFHGIHWWEARYTMSQVHSLARDRAGCPGSNCPLMLLPLGPHLHYYCLPVFFFCPSHVACGVRGEEILEYLREARSTINLLGLCVCSPTEVNLFCIRKAGVIPVQTLLSHNSR